MIRGYAPLSRQVLVYLLWLRQRDNAANLDFVPPYLNFILFLWWIRLEKICGMQMCCKRHSYGYCCTSFSIFEICLPCLSYQFLHTLFWMTNDNENVGCPLIEVGKWNVCAENICSENLSNLNFVLTLQELELTSHCRELQHTGR